MKLEIEYEDLKATREELSSLTVLDLRGFPNPFEALTARKLRERGYAVSKNPDKRVGAPDFVLKDAAGAFSYAEVKTRGGGLSFAQLEFMRVNGAARVIYLLVDEAGARLRCPRCAREWLYAGANPYCAPCPNCRTTVNIAKHSIKA